MNPPFGTNNNINSSSNNNVPHLIHMASAPGPSTSASPLIGSSTATTASGDRASPSSSHSLHQSSTTIGINNDF
jgi:hypothetical protein